MTHEHVLAIIPARGGSKGIAGKNLRPLAGQPLLAHSIEAALNCPLISKTVVSTDDAQIADVALAHGAEVVRRPDRLAADASLVIDAIRHAIDEVESQGEPVEVVVLLEPTSPLRRPQDVERCIQVLLDNEADSAATFTDAHVSPNRLWRVTDNAVAPYIDGAVPWLPRQKQPKAYELTGQVYAVRRSVLLAHPESISLLLGRAFAVLTPRETTVDIDTERDLIIAEQLMLYSRHQRAND